MRETFLLDIPHRQVVFTIPRMLRIFFKCKRRLVKLAQTCSLSPHSGKGNSYISGEFAFFSHTRLIRPKVRIFAEVHFQKMVNVKEEKVGHREASVREIPRAIRSGMKDGLSR